MEEVWWWRRVSWGGFRWFVVDVSGMWLAAAHTWLGVACLDHIRIMLFDTLGARRWWQGGGARISSFIFIYVMLQQLDGGFIYMLLRCFDYSDIRYAAML